jgi:hypothetical protein
MTPLSVPRASARRAFVFHFIEGRGRDLAHVLGASLAGLAYVALILVFAPDVDAVLSTTVLGVSAGGATLSLGLYAFVFVSYAWLFDGTHVFATWARVLGDDEERRFYAPAIKKSIYLLAGGPVLVLLAFAAGMFSEAARGASSLVAIGLVVVYQLWGFHHINRQHWGFVSMYRARAGEKDEPSRRADAAFFYTIAWSPLIAFATSGALESLPGVPALGLATLALGPVPIARIVHETALLAPFFAIALYVLFAVREWHVRRRPANVPKLALFACVGGLHALVFSDARLALCMTPILGLGHALQYHHVVWRYGRKARDAGSSNGVGRLVFGSRIVYGLALLACTALLFRGPMSEWLFAQAASEGGVPSMLDAMREPGALTLAQQLLGVVLMGVSAQHYYLDSVVWRMRRDTRMRDRLLARAA